MTLILIKVKINTSINYRPAIAIKRSKKLKRMSKRTWMSGFKLNIRVPGTGFILMLLALTQVPVAIKTLAEIYCMEKLGQKYNSAVVAIIQCNGVNESI